MKPDFSSNKSSCSLTLSVSGTSSQSSESSAYIDEEEMNNIKKQETPSFDNNFLAKDKSMRVNTKNRLHNHVLLLKREHKNRILMKSRSERTILRDSSTVHNFLNYKAAKSERSLLVLQKENNISSCNSSRKEETRLAPKKYIRDQVWDEHRRRFPTKKEQEEHQEVPLPAVDKPQQQQLDRTKQLLQRHKSFPDRRRSSLLRQHSFPRGLQDSNRYNHQDFLQDEIDFEEKFLLPDEDKRRSECHKTRMLPSPSSILCEVSPRLLESRRKNKANMSNFLFNSSLLWNSFKNSLKPVVAGLTMKIPQEILSIIKVLPGNDRCFDCNSRHDLVWAFVPHGTILCESCGFEHLRSVRDDDILSFSGDLDWKFKELISLLEGGNRALLSFLKQKSIENREHDLVVTAMKEQDFSSLYNSKTASQYRKLIRKKVDTVVMRYHDRLSHTGLE